jgi:hypothetical protein
MSDHTDVPMSLALESVKMTPLPPSLSDSLFFLSKNNTLMSPSIRACVCVAHFFLCSQSTNSDVRSHLQRFNAAAKRLVHILYYPQCAPGVGTSLAVPWPWVMNLELVHYEKQDPPDCARAAGGLPPNARGSGSRRWTMEALRADAINRITCGSGCSHCQPGGSPASEYSIRRPRL